MAGKNVAVIWGSHRDDPRFHTHHSFWEAAFEELGWEVSRYIWPEIYLLGSRNHSLYLFLDFHPTLFRVADLKLKPTAFVWWDSFHFSQAMILGVVPAFDRSYFAEYTSAVLARSYGLNVSWLPNAFYPGIFHPIAGREKLHDYAFLGQFDDVIWRNGDTRKTFLDRLATSPGLHGYMGHGIYGEQANGVYNDSRILFDRTIFVQLGMRIFECIGSGGFLLMNRLAPYSGLEWIGRDNQHFVTYDDTFEDLEAKLRYYLAHPDEREKIAQEGHAHFLENHTFHHRVKKILQDFNLR